MTIKLHCPKASLCGGCPLISYSLPQQRAGKLNRMRREVSSALALSEEKVPIRFHSAAARAGYRNRLRLQVSEKGEISFFNKEKDRDCVVLLPELRQSLERLRALSKTCARELQFFSHLELRAPDLDGRPSLCFTWRKAKGQNEHAMARLVASFSVEFILGFDLGSRPSQRYPLASGVYQRVALGSFMQVNFEVNEALVCAVVEGAKERGVSSVADLYCGSGNFLLPLLAAGFSGIGVEKNALAIEGAQLASREQGLGGDWICDDVPAWFTKQSQSGAPPFDLLVLDPPRAGLGKEIDWITALRPRYLALCSCDTRCVKDDLPRLLAAGFLLEEVVLFDMFEHTEQVETLIWLSREGKGLGAD